jgi:hypothetical protein
MVATFFASESPPTQARSSITTPTARLAISSRNIGRVAIVSEAVIGTRVEAASSARASKLFILIGSSNQNGP